VDLFTPLVTDGRLSSVLEDGRISSWSVGIDFDPGAFGGLLLAPDDGDEEELAGDAGVPLLSLPLSLLVGVLLRVGGVGLFSLVSGGGCVIVSEGFCAVIGGFSVLL
jgi:hypothetical protein